MKHTLYIWNKEIAPHPKEKRLFEQIRRYVTEEIKSLKVVQCLTIEKSFDEEALDVISKKLLLDQVTQESSLSHYPHQGDFVIKVSLKEGLTDNTANTARLTIEENLRTSFSANEQIRNAYYYLFNGRLRESDLEVIGNKILANPLIEEVEIQLPKTKYQNLSLNEKEIEAIEAFFLKRGTPPTDVELEAIAQTWSEHCKHKIFNAKVHFRGEVIDSLFKTFIKGVTDHFSEGLVSVFTDNAGIVEFSRDYNLAFKVETHNSPSALDPYGGALTGILGVNRDIMGAGIGARLVANTDLFCFAPLDYDKELPPGVLHPKRLFDGVRLGVEHGGNKSGVPTINGGLVFDESYLGRPVVYCGTVGILPKEINGRKTHIKEIVPGDLVVVAGGRTGRDGIHGATFSSDALHEKSPSSFVQIGDPFTQKKLHDFIIDARDKGLYRALTDNGAGGLSSSVGEMAEYSDGATIDLQRVPLKALDLMPWEILVSESQERMTLAVPKEDLDALKKLAQFHEVEIADIGEFNNSGHFIVYHGKKEVANLPLDFLHRGVPQLELEATFTETDKKIPLPAYEKAERLHALLASWNICSREPLIRQYDHEVQGGSVVKPLVGKKQDGPSDAAVFVPVETFETKEAFVLSNGICPRYSEYDPYQMGANALDEAIRNAVSVGADPDSLTILDNFSWPDPVNDPRKMGQLVLTCQGLHDYAIAMKTPIISGKDSMKNDYRSGEIKISIAPTLLISALGKVDAERSITMDFKEPSDLIYLLGETKKEFDTVPKVDPKQAYLLYRSLHQTILKGYVRSCHDLSDGGFAVAIAECCLAGEVGATVTLKALNASLSDDEKLFSESASRFVVSVPKEHRAAFETVMKQEPIGVVTASPRLIIDQMIDEPVEKLKHSFQSKGAHLT